ncbi:MAG: serine protease [Clostridia bacterium]|nr:serine protease [Clostridia bacterium]
MKRINNQAVFSSINGNTRYRPCGASKVYENHKSSKRGYKIFLSVLALVLVFTVGVVVGSVALNDGPSENKVSKPNEPLSDFAGTELDITLNSKPDDKTADNSGRMSIGEIFDFVSPSIVEISIYTDSDKNFSLISYSSGIVMSQDGYILTNDHIYTDIPDPVIYVTVGSESYKGTFVAGDTRRDISIIKIDAKDLKPAVFGKSSELEMGEDVYAIGNPARLENSITNGIVSSLNRRVTNADGYSEHFIQTNAAISGGSSGGALVNRYGQVVGITSSKYASTDIEGISFAIPIDEAIKMSADLLKNGKVTTRAKLGIRYVEVTVAEAEKNDVPVGLMFDSCSEDSSLYRSGIVSGDIITEINGTKITNSNIVLDIVDEKKPGDTVTLKVYSVKTGEYKEYKANMMADEGSTNYNAVTDSDKDRLPLFPEDEE